MISTKSSSVSVSVIIPVFNMERYLRQALDSALTQTLQDIEIVCVDDGSTDTSPAILAEYAARDPRVNIITQENSGVGPARNTGILAARGEFVAFLDPDDLYPSDDVLESLYLWAKEKGVQACGGSLCTLEVDGTVTRFNKDSGYFSDGVFEKNDLKKFAEYQYDYGFYRFIYDRELLIKNKIFFPDYIRYQDPPFMARALDAAETFYALHKDVYKYRHGHQFVDWKNFRRICDQLRGLRDLLKFSRERGYAKLHWLQIHRLFEEFKPHIIDAVRREREIFQSQMLHVEIRLDSDYSKPTSSFFEIIREIDELIDIKLARQCKSDLPYYSADAELLHFDIRVSVVIPVYNVENYLRQSLDSVVNQTIQDIEIICVDDGSTDSSPQILAEYAARDFRIMVIRQKNQYAGVARNNGMKIARGRYLAFFDPDDVYSPTALEKAICCIEENASELVMWGARLFSDKIEESQSASRGLLNTALMPKHQGFSLHEIPKNAFSICWGVPWNKLFLRKFVQANQLYWSATRVSNDIFFVAAALLSANRISYIVDELTYHRWRYSPKSLQGSIDDSPLDFIKAQKEIYDFLGARNLKDFFGDSFSRAYMGNTLSYFQRCRLKASKEKILRALRDGGFESFGVSFKNVWSFDEPARRLFLEAEFLDTPAVSVIIPVYNVEKYLRKCLDSVISQTLKEIEIICIDDGSTDSSRQILTEYAENDARIKIIHQENRGQGGARNIGMSHAQGEYIGFVDSDDWISPGFYENLYFAAKRQHADIAATSEILLAFPDGEQRKKPTGLENIEILTELSDRRHPSIATAVTCNKIYRRNFLQKEEILFHEPKSFGEDNGFSILTFFLSNKIAVIHNEFYFYFQREKSTVNNLYSQWKCTLASVYKALLIIIESKYISVPFLKETAIRRATLDFGWNYKKFSFVGRAEYLAFFCSEIPEIDWRSTVICLPCRVIVSMTSYPARIDTVHKVIETLLSQTWKADGIILWLASSQFPQNEHELPQQLLALQGLGLEIRWCEDLKSFKKLVPALKAFPEDIIVTVDDDLFLEPTWLEELVCAHVQNPTAIYAHRAHEVSFADKNTLNPYAKWTQEVKTSRPSFNNFMTGVGGCLYPPRCLHKDVFDEQKFLELCPCGDDIWFWAMAVLNDTLIGVTRGNFRLNFVENTQKVSLWHKNVRGGGNDAQLAKVLTAYPAVLEKLERRFLSEEKTNKAHLASVLTEKVPTIWVRLGGLFILSKSGRKRWLERHLGSTVVSPEMQKNSMLKRFISLFILPRRIRKKLWRLFDTVTPAGRAKIEHTEGHLIRVMEGQTKRILELVAAARMNSERCISEVKQELIQVKKQSEALSRKIEDLRKEIETTRIHDQEALSLKIEEQREALMLKMLSLRYDTERKHAALTEFLTMHFDKLNERVENIFSDMENVKAEIEAKLNPASDVQKKLEDTNFAIKELHKQIWSNGKTTKEISWSSVFNDTIASSEWLQDRAFSPGRWAAGYPFLYVLFRTLNDGEPVAILEMGLGQTTRMIAQYAAARMASHTLVEHDIQWIQFFEKSFVLPSITHIENLELIEAPYADDPGVICYKDFEEKFAERKFDFICIDGPFGGAAKIYSRIDILKIIPKCLNSSFVIMIDDFERKGEQATVAKLRTILKEHDIAFCEATYAGEKQLHLIASPDKKFLCSL